MSLNYPEYGERFILLTEGVRCSHEVEPFSKLYVTYIESLTSLQEHQFIIEGNPRSKTRRTPIQAQMSNADWRSLVLEGKVIPLPPIVRELPTVPPIQISFL